MPRSKIILPGTVIGGLVLFYDYVPAEDGRRFKQERKFPCTEFTILRDKRDGFIVDVVCGGTVLEPEGEATHFTVPDFESGRAGGRTDHFRPQL
jgi:hypothetical protein